MIAKYILTTVTILCIKVVTYILTKQIYIYIGTAKNTNLHITSQ